MKKYIMIVLVALAIFTGIYFLGKAAGTKPKNRKLPNSGSGIPQDWDPGSLAARLRDVLSGINWKGWFSTDSFHSDPERDAVLNELLLLSTDDMFVATWNAYNNRYRAELRDDILEEWFLDEDILTGLMARFDQNEEQV